MIEIALQEVEKYYGSNHVLRGVSFEVRSGDRLALLGQNGAGKTTVFNIINGSEGCDAGTISIRKGAKVGTLAQFGEFPDSWTVTDVLYSAYGDLFELQQRLRQLEECLAQAGDRTKELQEYCRLQPLFEARQGYAMEENMAKVCTGLSFSASFLQLNFGLLSGGERTKVMLGRLLLQEPDVLLLDEPTNHLDIEAIEWLEKFLSKYRGTVIVISHDRYFLNKVVNGVVELVGGKADFYRGNYSYFVAEKEARQQQQLAQYEQEQKKIRQLEAAAKRLHEWGQQADNPQLHRQAFNIEKRIERMDKTEKPRQEKRLNASFAQQCFSGEDVIVLNDVVKRYDGQLILDGIGMAVRRGERVALLGKNGSGKSTLLKLVTGEVTADQGSVKLGSSIRYGYLPQVITFPQEEQSVLERARLELQVPEGDARRILAKYRFKEETVYKRLSSLSGGERSRLSLCFLMQTQVNLLILDEPTNHLDIDSREWLEEALSEFSGVIFFVSHDRYFIERFATRILELKNGSIIDYAGGYEVFRQTSKACGSTAKAAPATAVIKPKPTKASRNITRDTLAAERDKTEKSINEQECIRRELETQMALCSDDFITLEELYQKKCEVEQKIEQLYQVWMEQNA